MTILDDEAYPKGNPTNRKTLTASIREACEESLRQADEEQDQIGFIVPRRMLLECADIDMRESPGRALQFILKICDPKKFQVSYEGNTHNIMVNTWPRSPSGFEGFADRIQGTAA